jgi:hypothetical protein
MTAPSPALEQLQYPIGKFSYSGLFSAEQRAKCIEDIAATPKNLRAAVSGLSAEQLETPYREGGWSVRQVTHHVPESHMNAYIRFKLALTEDSPTIKPYREDAWAKTADVAKTPVESSLALMEPLHERWVNLLRSMTAADFQRKLTHPEKGLIDLDFMLGLYSWHGKHHVAHITSLKQRKGWK